jgi:hypothetical protein
LLEYKNQLLKYGHSPQEMQKFSFCTGSITRYTVSLEAGQSLDAAVTPIGRLNVIVSVYTVTESAACAI